jgi:hypothetical protein
MMNQANSIIKYANEIIHEANSEAKTWTTSLHNKLIISISKMSKQEANLFVRIIMNEILDKTCKPFPQFKLCQVCSIIQNQNLHSFQNAFLQFHSKIRGYLDSETETTCHFAIKLHLTNLLKERKSRKASPLSNIRFLENSNSVKLNL